MVATSDWWAAPVDPARWFSGEELGRSRALHRPVERVAAIRTVGQLLAVAGLGVYSSGVGPPGEALSLSSSLLIAIALAMALWVPGLVADIWWEFRHRPKLALTSLPPSRFATVAVATALVVAAAGAAVGVLTAEVVAATTWWPVVFAVFALGSAWFSGPRLARQGTHDDPVPRAVEESLAQVAERSGCADVRFEVFSDAGEEEMNAVAFGLRGPPVVACTTALLDADPEIRDFVVAHELAHLRRRHHRAAFVAAGCGLVVELASLWALVQWSSTAAWFGQGLHDARSWPLAVAVLAVAGVPVGLVEAWLARRHERQADRDAIGVVGSPSQHLLRSLHRHDGSDLDPRALARWWARHPSPAERMRASAREI